jgi:FkbM family methyltransferase
MIRMIKSITPEPLKAPIRQGRSLWFRYRYRKNGVPGILSGESFRFKLGYEPLGLKAGKLWEDDRLLQIAFREAIRPGDTVLDVGAFVGYYTLLAARRAGAKGRVIAIEPAPITYHILMEHLVLNDLMQNVEVWPVAVGDTNGFVNIYYQGHDPVRGHNSTNPSLFFDRGLTENLTFKVAPCIALGSFLDGISVKPDVIKMDIEGAEIETLQTLRHILQGTATVFCELHPSLWKEAEVQFSILQELMMETGRRIETLDGGSWKMGQHEPVVLRKLS